MWWVIHMCRGFDPLFSLWQDRARSFWGIFLIHQQQSYLLGYKNYQYLQKSIFLAPNSIFSSIFLGPIFSGQRHTPISFQAEYWRTGYVIKSHSSVWGVITYTWSACQILAYKASFITPEWVSTHWPLWLRCGSNLISDVIISKQRLPSSLAHVKLLSGECHRTHLMMSQH